MCKLHNVDGNFPVNSNYQTISKIFQYYTPGHAGFIPGAGQNVCMTST